MAFNSVASDTASMAFNSAVSTIPPATDIAGLRAMILDTASVLFAPEVGCTDGAFHITVTASDEGVVAHVGKVVQSIGAVVTVAQSVHQPTITKALQALLTALAKELHEVSGATFQPRGMIPINKDKCTSMDDGLVRCTKEMPGATAPDKPNVEGAQILDWMEQCGQGTQEEHPYTQYKFAY